MELPETQVLLRSPPGYGCDNLRPKEIFRAQGLPGQQDFIRSFPATMLKLRSAISSATLCQGRARLIEALVRSW